MFCSSQQDLQGNCKHNNYYFPIFKINNKKILDGSGGIGAHIVGGSS